MLDAARQPGHDDPVPERGPARSSSSTSCCSAGSSSSRSSSPAALVSSIGDFIANLPALRDEPAADPRAVAGAPERARARRRRPAGQAAIFLDNINQLRGPARRAAPADRGRQPRRDRQPAARRDPVAVHGRRPRPARGLGFWLVPPQYKEEAEILERASAARSAASSAARRSWASSSPPWLRRQRHLRARLPGRHDVHRRAPHGHPVLRPVLRLGPAGARRDAVQAGCDARRRSSSSPSAGSSS